MLLLGFPIHSIHCGQAAQGVSDNLHAAVTVNAGNHKFELLNAFLPRNHGVILRADSGKSFPAKESRRTVVTLAAIAIIAQTGWTQPVVASGTPMPLKQNASARFCTVLRKLCLAM